MLGAVLANLRDGALDDGKAAQYATEAHRWLRRENLADSLSIGERTLVAKPLEDWSEQESSAVGWRDEAAGVLLWAISAVDELPRYDTRFDSIPSLVPLLAPTADFRLAASLRPAEEIGRARDVAELWHWRSRTTQLRRGGDGSEPDAERAPIGHVRPHCGLDTGTDRRRLPGLRQGLPRPRRRGARERDGDRDGAAPRAQLAVRLRVGLGQRPDRHP